MKISIPMSEAASVIPRVAKRIVSCLLEAASRARVFDVRIGLGYTAVMLVDGRTGVAFTFRDQAPGGCAMFNGIRPLSTRPAADLLVLLESQDTIEAGVGLACANALANRALAGHLNGDILDHLDLREHDRVGMVGHFGPLVGPIQQRVRSLNVFERVDQPSGILRPAKEAAATLPHCQIALITATSVINHTVDSLLDAASSCREVVLLGPSTPMLEAVLGVGQVTMLSGIVVEEPEEVLQVVSEGGGMRQFSRHVRKVSVRIANPKTDSARSTE